MFVGRYAERARVDELIARAASGQGGALALRGEAGIGKSALLEHVVANAAGEVLRARGAEAETRLPFATLHELLRPLASSVDRLPAPQAAALNAALAIAPADGTSRLAVYAATLTLLASAAADRAVICIVDDAHWVDEASAGALGFVARRLEHDAVALLVSGREVGPALAGLEAVELGGLGVDEARALLAARRPSLPPAAADVVVRAARGNPLALLEFATALDDGEGLPALDEPLAVGEEVQRTFARRAQRLSPESRRALLLAAAGEASGPDVIWAALEHEQVGSAAVREAQGDELLLAGNALQFCHPLARSAIYHSAPPAEVRTAHRTLARVTPDPIARAWHLAEAATSSDASVADALERAAAEARGRGGAAVEAGTLERSARLTADVEPRARRLVAAAAAAEAAGHAIRAERLLAEAAELSGDAVLRADAAARRSYLLFDRGDFDAALRIATEAADAARPALAARVLASSGIVHALAHRLDVTEARRIAERASWLADTDGDGDLDLAHMLAWTWELTGRTSDALELARAALPRVDPETVLAIDVAAHFVYLEDYGTAREAFQRIVGRLRRTSAFGNLAYALDHLANLNLRTGRTVLAYGYSTEAVQLMESIGVDVGVAASLARLALIEAVLGQSERAREHGARALEVAAARGDRWNEVRARAALGFEALTAGEYEPASTFLTPAVQMLADGGVHHPNAFRVHGDLVEALVRAGRRDEAAAELESFERDAEQSASPWARAVAARCGALLADDSACEAAFAAACEADGAGELERARTLLAYGERLRRLRRVREAREPLRGALESFERVAAARWAERARAELRATGARVPSAGRGAHEELTPQELQVALAVADGLTNKEVAARLFLSPKTIEFHLTRAYRKLGVRSRAELTRVLERSRTIEP
ncbi:MAG TPA: LuxR family transcriptional regulator [Gaiellaceae bacterium]|nr:LuxR family transcriptional regulator [Gaiellaceae bacterium]